MFAMKINVVAKLNRNYLRMHAISVHGRCFIKILKAKCIKLPIPSRHAFTLQLQPQVIWETLIIILRLVIFEIATYANFATG